MTYFHEPQFLHAFSNEHQLGSAPVFCTENWGSKNNGCKVNGKTVFIYLPDLLHITTNPIYVTLGD